MSDLVDFAILFGVGILSGIINVMAGGGSSLTLPALIFLGLDGATANGTNRIAIIVQSIFATLSFRQDKVTRLRTSLRLSLWTLPGAVLGAVVAVRISDAWFERILGLVLVGVVISMLLPRGERATTAEGIQSAWIHPVMFAIGFYGGFIQVGVGFLLMAALYHLLRLDLVFVNAHKVVIVLVYTLPTLVIFAWTDNIDWLLGLDLAVGNAVGAYGAARLAVRRGERLVRIVLVVAVLIMAAKILGLF